jgi:hypothetical protein
MLMRGNAAIVDTVSTPTIPSTAAVGELGHYRIADLLSFAVAPESFYAFTYRDTLRAMVGAVMDAESPLRTDILCQRIARAHGWQRTGPRIREQIAMHLRDFDRTTESGAEFIWKKSAIVQTHPYRKPATEDARRSIAETPLAELVSVVQDYPDLLDMPDPARDMARLLGVERLASAARARLDEALACASVIASATNGVK